MSRHLTEVDALAQRSARTAAPAETQKAVFQCLVVSSSRDRRDMLARAATDAGWDAIVCADPENARAECRRTFVQMALVDLQGHGSLTPSGFRQFSEELASDGGKLLLAVCGHEGDPHEEIWARQLGAWLYLPGVTDRDEVTPLCRQGLVVARRIVGEKEESEVTVKPR